MNRVDCESDDSVTIECDAQAVINIIGGNFGRTLPYDQACSYSSERVADTNCFSDESKQIVSDSNLAFYAITHGSACDRIKKHMLISHKYIESIYLEAL